MFYTKMNFNIRLFNYRLELEQRQKQIANAHYSYEKIKQQLDEKEEQYKEVEEKHQLEMSLKRLKRIHTEFRSPRLEMDKVN